MTRKALCLLFAAALFLSAGCAAPAGESEPAAAAQADAAQAASPAPAKTEPTVSAEETAVFSVSSTGVTDGVLDDRYGMRGSQLENGVPTLSPPLSFAGIPNDAACLALVVTDPDAGGWVHWLAANLPLSDLAENASIELSQNIVQGQNDFGTTGYGGPTPPSGTHAYEIAVYALQEPLELADGYSLADFQAAIEGNILAEATLTATYAH